MNVLFIYFVVPTILYYLAILFELFGMINCYFLRILKVFNDEYKSLTLCYISITNFKKISKKLNPYELNLT